MKVLVGGTVEELEMRINRYDSEDYAFIFISHYGGFPNWNEEHEMYEMTHDEFEFWSDVIAEELFELGVVR